MEKSMESHVLEWGKKFRPCTAADGPVGRQVCKEKRYRRGRKSEGGRNSGRGRKGTRFRVNVTTKEKESVKSWEQAHPGCAGKKK